MTEQMHSHAGMANRVGAALCAPAARRGARDCRISGTMLQLISVFRTLWPHKPVAELQARTGRSERACQYWLSRQCEISIDDLAKLLRSDDGLVFLEAMIGDARPVWWAGFKKRVQIAETNRRMSELKRDLDRLNQQDD